MPRPEVIYLKAAAPAKPAPGAPCNGCGVCCAAETCPVARVFLWQQRGPCRALLWQDAASRYACGLLVDPAAQLRWLPAMLAPAFSRLVRRWIAAGAGCDSDAAPLSDCEPISKE